MRAVDTNVVVRFLTGDDPDQFALAMRLIQGTDIYVPMTVLLETEWVLRYFYGYSPSRVVESLRDLASLESVTLENAESAAIAFKLTDDGVDFADALHLARAGLCEDFVTFDPRLARRASDPELPSVTLLKD